MLKTFGVSTFGGRDNWCTGYFPSRLLAAGTFGALLAADIMITPLTAVINSSITQGEFPESWKWAKIVPVYKKKGSKFDKKNYRPVSLLKSTSKILEIIVNQQVLNYAETSGILPKSQFGFRARRSTFNTIATIVMDEDQIN